MTPLFEKLGGTYSKEGEYLIPNLCAPAGEYHIGKYGRMRLSYLKRHRRVLYVNLLTTGTLYGHLWDIDQRCAAQVEQLVAAHAMADGTDEALKARDQMRWVGLMNNYRNAAEEVVIREAEEAYGIMELTE